MKMFFTLLLFSFLLCQNIFSQSLYSSKSDSLMVSDTGYVPDNVLVEKMNPRKPLWLTILESVGLNLALGAFNS